MVSEEKVSAIVKLILERPDAGSLTGRTIRKLVSEQLGLEEGALESSRWKLFIDKAIMEEFANATLAFEEAKTIGGCDSKKQEISTGASEKKRRLHKTDTIKQNTTFTSPTSNLPTNPNIERLKTYIVKCGVRKLWKKELDGLSEKEAEKKLQKILVELGMEGKPTLQKCKELKEQREFKAEIESIKEEHPMVVEGRTRGETKRVAPLAEQRSKSDHDNRLDLSKYGDSEDDEDD